MAHPQVRHAWSALEPPRRPPQEEPYFVFREERLLLSHLCHTRHPVSGIGALYGLHLPYVHRAGYHHLWFCLLFRTRHLHTPAVQDLPQLRQLLFSCHTPCPQNAPQAPGQRRWRMFRHAVGTHQVFYRSPKTQSV